MFLDKIRDIFSNTSELQLVDSNGYDVDIKKAKYNSLLSRFEYIQNEIKNLKTLVDSSSSESILKSYFNSLEDEKIIKSDLVEFIEENKFFFAEEIKKSEENSITKKLFQPYLDVIERVLKNKKKKLFADGIIMNEKGEVLLLLRFSPKEKNDELNDKWSLPGGHVDRNENPEDACKREVEEETNLKVNRVSCRFVKKVNEDVEIFYYNCFVDDLDKQTLILDANEHKGYEWVDYNKLQTLDCIYDLKEVLNQIVFYEDTFRDQKVEVEIKKSEEKNKILWDLVKEYYKWQSNSKYWNKASILEFLQNNHEDYSMNQDIIDFMVGVISDETIEDLEEKEINKADQSFKIGDEKEWHKRKFKLTPIGWTHVDNEKNSALKKEKQNSKVTIQDFSDDELDNHAYRSSTNDLNTIIKEGRNPRLREIAQKHLNDRKLKDKLPDLVLLEDLLNHTYSKEDDCLHFEEEPKEDLVKKLEYKGIKYKVKKKEEA